MVKREAGARLRRLLALLPWLAEVGTAPIAEVAERCGLGEGEVVELLELAACCGLPPYTPDQLMELIVSDGWVTANLGAHLSRPQRLTAAEGFTLAASARAILAVPGADPDGALARALSKLEAVLGSRLAVELDEPPLLDVVRRAAVDGERLEMAYYAESRDELTHRMVDPWAVFVRDGHWYLDGWCHLAAGRRLFRVDRVRAARPAGERGPADAGRAGAGEPGPAGSPGSPGPGAPPEHPARPHPVPGDSVSGRAVRLPVPEAFVPGPETRAVTLSLPPDGRWVVESYPAQGVEELPDGRWRIVLPVGGRAWLERLLLRLGPDAEVLDPPDLADAGRRAAGRILARYG